MKKLSEENLLDFSGGHGVYTSFIVIGKIRRKKKKEAKLMELTIFSFFFFKMHYYCFETEMKTLVHVLGHCKMIYYNENWTNYDVIRFFC